MGQCQHAGRQHRHDLVVALPGLAALFPAPAVAAMPLPPGGIDAYPDRPPLDLPGISDGPSLHRTFFGSVYRDARQAGIRLPDKRHSGYDDQQTGGLMHNGLLPPACTRPRPDFRTA